MSARPVLVLVCALAIVIPRLKGQDPLFDTVHYTPIPRTYGMTRKEISSMEMVRYDTAITSGVHYFGILQTGALAGCRDCVNEHGVSFSSTLTNGVTLGRKLRAGFGLGIDSYRDWETMPLFGMVAWDVIGNIDRNGLFIAFAAGTSKAWRENTLNEYGLEHVKGGRMLAPQIGYRIRYHDVSLGLSLGIRSQRVFTFYEYPNWIWTGADYQQMTARYSVKQDMSRLQIVVSVGWR